MAYADIPMATGEEILAAAARLSGDVDVALTIIAGQHGDVLQADEFDSAGVAEAVADRLAGQGAGPYWFDASMRLGAYDLEPGRFEVLPHGHGLQVPGVPGRLSLDIHLVGSDLFATLPVERDTARRIVKDNRDRSVQAKVALAPITVTGWLSSC